MPDLVELVDLNQLRFPQSPRNPKLLQRLARNGELPGARMIGGRWFVDLEKFDQGVPVPVRQTQFEPIEATRERVKVLMREAMLAGGADASTGTRRNLRKNL